MDRGGDKVTKKCDRTYCYKICNILTTVIPSRDETSESSSRIQDTESAKVIFSVTVTFCRTKTENRTKKPLT